MVKARAGTTSGKAPPVVWSIPAVLGHYTFVVVEGQERNGHSGPQSTFMTRVWRRLEHSYAPRRSWWRPGPSPRPPVRSRRETDTSPVLRASKYLYNAGLGQIQASLPIETESASLSMGTELQIMFTTQKRCLAKFPPGGIDSCHHFTYIYQLSSDESSKFTRC